MEIPKEMLANYEETFGEKDNKFKSKYEYNWEYGYGKLKKGTYRLVTDFSKEQNKIYVAAEFIIK